MFQTPFGITACESVYNLSVGFGCQRFKRLSASLHVKGCFSVGTGFGSSRFKRLSASLHVKGDGPKTR